MEKQKITPFLWYNNQAEEAAKFYCSIFKNSRIISANAMSVIFELDGQRIHALNGGPQFKFTEAFSLYVDCETQDEVDYYWNKLTEGGSESMCGWLKDKYGLSWQIIPYNLGQLIGDADPAKAQRAVQAMFQMKKLDMAKLEAAHAGK